MKVQGIKVQESSLNRLNNLLRDENRKVHGVFYTNSYFSQRYLSRSHALVDNVNLEEDSIKLTVSTRLERTGLLEIENTLELLVQHEAGDVPGFTPEGVLPDLPQGENPFMAETVGVKQQLFSLDLLLIMRKPRVTQQKFTIAGVEFVLVNLIQNFGEDFEQNVTLLFGDVAKLYFFSHFYNKKLSVRDMKILIDLIVDKNITGKSIVGVKLESLSGASSSVFPYEELISSYRATSGDYIFGTGTGYVRIPYQKLADYRMSLVPNPDTGSYRIDLESYKDTIRIYME